MARYVLLFWLWAALAQAQTQTRHALVIGNATYDRVPLNNTVKDARDVASILRDIGFDVVEATNVDSKTFSRRVASYAAALAPGDVSFVFYSGHGVQANNENYLIPVDFNATEEHELAYDAYPLGKLMERIADRQPALSVVVLDACRDNPFRRSRGGNKGLTVIEHVAQGTLIAFATSPGQTADDGAPGKNGVYTASLLKMLKKTGLEVEAMFRAVREDVVQKTDGGQVPWSSSSVVGTYSLTGTYVPVKGVLQIVTAPPGASISIDGTAGGVTPFQQELGAGQHSVAIALEGFANVKRSVQVDAGKTNPLFLALTPLRGTLQVNSTPPGAQLTLDGRTIGTTPVSTWIEAGKHTAILRLNGFLEQRESVVIKANETTPLEVTMKEDAPPPPPPPAPTPVTVAAPTTVPAAALAPPPAPTPVRPAGLTPMSIAGLSALGAGAVGLGVGLGVGFQQHVFWFGSQTEINTVHSMPYRTPVYVTISVSGAVAITGAVLALLGGQSTAGAASSPSSGSK